MRRHRASHRALPAAAAAATAILTAATMVATVMLAASAVAQPAAAIAPEAPAVALDLDAELPLDPALTIGTLDNGLRYILRGNDRPEDRAELRLVVAAGSVDEDDDQRGLAHFLEHMVFNGTESWAGNDIVDFLERIGADFGADLNAYTSFDETVYMLEVPTDQEGLLHDGLKVLSEFAARATISDEEVEKERGVVLDEWRRGLGAGSRIRDRQLPVILKGSRYAERLPIGLPEIIREAPPEAIRRYYRDWYRPERMAVIAVGDFRTEDVEEQIRELFGSFRPEGEARPRTDWEVPSHADTLLALADDPELRGTSVGVSFKRPLDPADVTYGDYRDELVRRAALGMFNSRLAEVVRTDDAPFLGAGFGVSSFGRTVEIAGLSARVREGEEARGLRAIALEARRAALHGFSESELDRSRRELLAGIEATYAERDKTPSGRYVSEYTRHILDGEPVPGIQEERRIWRELVPGITVEECNTVFRGLLRGDGVVVEATRPSGDDLTPGEDLLDALREAAAAQPEPWLDEGADGELLAVRAQPGSVVDRTEHEAIGVTEVRLSNGVHVLIKPTDFQADEIRLTGNALGGTSVAEDDALLSARFANGIVQESGWGGRTPIALGKLLAGKVASVNPFFDGNYHGVSGSATVGDLDTLLDLVVLVMTEPNRDEAAFRRFLDRLRVQLERRDASPGTRFYDRVNAINTLDDPRRRPVTVDRIGEIDLDEAIAFYRGCFANAADFDFVIAGNVDVDALLPRLERTIGALPSRGEPTGRWVERPSGFPEAPVTETVHAGQEPRGQVIYTLASYEGDDPREWHRLRTAASILERRLRDTLREDLGATYGVSAGYNFSMVGPNPGRVQVGFGCDPERSEELIALVEQAIDGLRETEPTADELDKEREIQTRDVETALRQNGFWLGSLSSLRMRDRPLEEILGRIDRIRELTREDLHRVFRDHFRRDRTTTVIWKPEEAAVTP